MDIPDPCENWKRMMESGSEASQVLANIEADPCYDGGVTEEFFARLAARGDPASPQQAWAFAYETVREAPNKFVCQGWEVPGELFAGLFRLQRVSSLRYVLPPEVLDGKGLRDREFAGGISHEDLRCIVDQYEGPVKLGNELQVVWVTDVAQIEGLREDINQIIIRLGLPPDRYVLCEYNREDTNRTLHVPRALDAVNQPLFEVVVDCSADYGRTRVIGGSAEEGLPEAVHRACSIVPTRWELAESSD